MELSSSEKYPQKIAVLMGGVGSEREVSLQSGRNIAEVLAVEGFQTLCADITPEDLAILEDKSIDLFFLALHGEWGEDGQIQQILEERSLIFTGSGSQSSNAAFDKIKSKKLFADCGVPTALSYEINSNTSYDELEKKLSGRDGKFVIKPPLQGSSVGVEVRTGAFAAIRTAKDCLKKYGSAMIEDFLPGREFTVGIVGDQVLPIVEIRSEMGFYDFTAKYLSDNTEYLFDTIEDAQLIAKLKEDAKKCFDAVGARDLARVDFMLDADGNHFALEINNLPGFTSHSLLPKAALEIGMNQGQLCKAIIASAMTHKTD